MNTKQYSLTGIILSAAFLVSCGKREIATEAPSLLGSAAYKHYETVYAETKRLATQIAKSSADSIACTSPQEQDKVFMAVKLYLSTHPRYELPNPDSRSSNRVGGGLPDVERTDYQRMATELETKWNPVLKSLADKGTVIQFGVPEKSPAKFTYIPDKQVLLVQEPPAFNTQTQTGRASAFGETLSFFDFRNFAASLANEPIDKTAAITIAWTVNDMNQGTMKVPAGHAQFTPVGYEKFAVPAPACKL